MDVTWKNICKNNGVCDEICQKWLEKLKSKYLEAHRFYHNMATLINKLAQIENESDYIKLAVIFQYYEFDLQRTNEECRMGFNDFFIESEIKDVSLHEISIRHVGKW